jgi:hypothetical protein
MTGLLAPFEFLARDRVDDRHDFLVRQRRPAASYVPGADYFERDPGVDAATQQVAGEPCNAVVALAFGDAVRRQLPPLGGRRGSVAASRVNDPGD